ncbi:MAG: copper homeostasis protein CutC [Fimbriimonadales bacterium]
MTCLVEAVAWSVEDALTAQQCGADRIELVSAIELDGLTPSIGMVREVLAVCELPVMAIVRPRDGGFVYSEEEFRTMEREVEALAEAGVHGIVLGILSPDDTIDRAACQRMLRLAPGLQKVCHRALDRCPDPGQALSTLIELGFTRVLTSGGAPTALEGADALRRLVELAGTEIEVMPVGGIRPGNVRPVHELTGAKQVHLAPMVRKGIGTGLFGGGYNVLDGEELRAVVESAKASS